MKPNLGKFSNLELDRAAIKLTQILTHVNLDNMQYRVISGTTDPVANTQRLFRHGMDPRPWIGLFQTQGGGCYVRNIGNVDIDIRSTVAGSDFTIILLG